MSDTSQYMWDEIKETKQDVKDIDKRIQGIEKNINTLMPVVERLDNSIDKHEEAEKVRLVKIEAFDRQLENISGQLGYHVTQYEKDKDHRKWKFEQVISILAIIIAGVSIVFAIN